MSRLLKGIGIFLFAVGLLVGVLGVPYPGSFWISLCTVVSGFLSGMIFIALGVILEQAEENRDYLHYIANLLPKPEQPAERRKSPAKKDSRSALEKLKDYKFELSDSDSQES